MGYTTSSGSHGLKMCLTGNLAKQKLMFRQRVLNSATRLTFARLLYIYQDFLRYISTNPFLLPNIPAGHYFAF